MSVFWFPFVHDLCTLGFFCYLYNFAFYRSKKKKKRITTSMRCFIQVIDDLELRDFPIQGGQFTWKGGLHNCRMARLDMFLVSEEWDCLFGGSR